MFDCFFFVCFTDGDENEENIRGRLVRSNNAGGCQELLRTVRTGKQNYHLNRFLIQNSVEKYKTE